VIEKSLRSKYFALTFIRHKQPGKIAKAVATKVTNRF